MEKVRRTYEELGSYHDRGIIERRRGEAGELARFRFETWASDQGRFVFVLEAEDGSAERQVFWREGHQAFHFDAGREQYRRVKSLVSSLVHTFGPGGFEALAVPAILAGEPEALASPEVAAVDGPEPCADASCYRLSAARMSRAIELELWIDVETLLLRELEVKLHPAEAVLQEAAASVGLALRPRTGAGSRAASLTISVRYDIQSRVGPGSHDPPPEIAAAFTPPATARRVEAWEPDPPPRQPGEPAIPSLPDLDVVFRDRIGVALVTVAVRVVDSRGNPVADLVPEDFAVRLGRETVRVQGVDWVSSHRPLAPQIPPQVLAETGMTVDPPGKLVVFFVQADKNPVRLAGHLRMLPEASRFLEGLHRDDRIAVVSFDSHLKLRQDFTADRQLLEQALRQAIRTGKPPFLKPGYYPSLARHLDADAARRAASPEKALELVGKALELLHGEKVLVFLGWGLGRYGSSGFQMTHQYRLARRALEAAKVTVFVLDVTDADWHTLELGLRQVVRDTGGTYAKTHIFTAQATNRLARTISGHYVLTLERPTQVAKPRRLRIKLVDKEGTVLTQVQEM